MTAVYVQVTSPSSSHIYERSKGGSQVIEQQSLLKEEVKMDQWINNTSGGCYLFTIFK